MASGNRVEELESRVKELEASVNGLTDELLECKERLEVLEDEVDPDMDIIEGGPTRSATTPEPDASTDRGDGETAADSDNTDGGESGDSSDAGDIIVA